MHFRVQTADINKGLNMVLRALSPRPIRPVYEGVFLEAGQGTLRLTVTDGDVTIVDEVPAVIEDEGSCLLPARLFGELMRKQAAGEVEISLDNKNKVTLRTPYSTTNMIAPDAAEFPDVSDVGGEEIALPSDRMRDAVSRILFAVSVDESRKILTGVLMEVYPEETLFVGLDGFRLALQRVFRANDLKGKEKLSCVIPGTIMTEISRMLPDDPDLEVRIRFGAGHIVFMFGQTRVYSVLLNGQYIDYQRILPNSWTSQINLLKSDFSNAIERTSLMAREGKNNLIHFTLEPEKPMVITSNAERGDVYEEVPCHLEGSKLKIAFNSRYLLDLCRNVDDSELRLCFNSNVSPCMVLPKEGRNFIYLVLPVRTFD